MRISLMTILTINLSLSIFLVILLPLLDREFILKNLGGRLLAACCIAVMIRALIPLEFPFSRTIPVREVLPSIRDFMKYPITAGGFSVKVSGILLFTWISVSVLLIIRKILLYLQLQKTMERLPECTDRFVQDILRSLLEKYPSCKNIRVVRADLNISPLIAGFKNPVILLPEYSFTEEEYRMILEHEILHCVRHDIPVRFAADILCSIYWWNLPFYSLRKKIFELIELGNDRQLTVSFSTEEKAAYMQCLRDTAEKICSNPVPFTLSFGNDSGKALSRRIHLIGSFRDTRRIKNCLAVGILLLLLWISTSFTLEPYIKPEGGPYIIFDKDNCYFIQKEDFFEIYYRDEFYTTIDSIEYFSPDIPVYQKEGEPYE